MGESGGRNRLSKSSIVEWVSSLLKRQFKAMDPMPDRTKKLIVRTLLALSCIVPFLMVLIYFSSRSLPWGSDGGNLLKYANALQADIALRLGLTSSEDAYLKLLPMWGVSAWQYPPLFILILDLTNKLFDPILNIKLLGALALSLQPLPAFLIAKMMAKSDLAGLLAAFGSSVAPIYVEMLGWGGYPNLLGFLLIGFAIYFILCAMENSSKRNILGVVVLSVLLTFTHLLAILIYAGTLIGWVLLMVIFRGKGEKVRLSVIIVGLASSIASFLLYRFTLAWPTSFIFFNEAAYYELRFEPLSTIPFTFKDSVLVIVIGLIAFTVFFVVRGVLDKRYLTLLFSWVAFPFIATFGFLFGVALDYTRVFFFVVQPLLILTATPIALIHNSSRLKLTPPFRRIKRMMNVPIPFKVNFRKLGAYILIVLSIFVPLDTISVGFATMNNVNNFYNSTDFYGDREKLAALNWIAENTYPSDTFVTEGLIARWVEGYSMRRAFVYTAPKYFFIEGELDRYYIASSIFESNYEAKNCYVRVLDQTPYNTGLSPQINFWFKGEYHKYLSFNDFELATKLSLNDKQIVVKNLTRYDVTASGIKSSNNKAIINVTYENPLVKIEKSIIITKNDPKVVIAYRFSPVNSSITLHNATITAFLSKERRIDLVESGLGWARVESDVGSMIINAQNASITAYMRDFPQQRIYDVKGIYMTFLSNSDGSIRASIEVSLMGSSERNCLCNLEAHSRDELIREYGISYIVLPRVALRGVMTFSEYQHLLDDKGLKIAYLNDKVIILKTS